MSVVRKDIAAFYCSILHKYVTVSRVRNDHVANLAGFSWPQVMTDMLLVSEAGDLFNLLQEIHISHVLSTDVLNAEIEALCYSLDFFQCVTKNRHSSSEAWYSIL